MEFLVFLVVFLPMFLLGNFVGYWLFVSINLSGLMHVLIVVPIGLVLGTVGTVFEHGFIWRRVFPNSTPGLGPITCGFVFGIFAMSLARVTGFWAPG